MTTGKSLIIPTSQRNRRDGSNILSIMPKHLCHIFLFKRSLENSIKLNLRHDNYFPKNHFYQNWKRQQSMLFIKEQPIRFFGFLDN